MITNRYDEVEDVIYVNRSGEVTCEDILNSILALDHTYAHLDSLYIIEDKKGSESLFHKEDFPAIIDSINEHIGNYKNVYLAVLVDDPANTVISLLFGYITNTIDNCHYSTFSTIEAARAWIKNLK